MAATHYPFASRRNLDQNSATSKEMSDDFRFASYDEELRRQIVEFHNKPDPALVIPILRRIIKHYLPKYSSLTVDTVMEGSLADLGLDSLTLMEITLDVQDAFKTTFSNEELKHLTSFSEITALIDQKIKTLSDGGV
jgi:acyl carrier protein